MTTTHHGPLDSTGNGPGDLLLVQAALRGDGAAVDALLVRLGCVPRFVHRINRLLGHGLPADALEDVVQQVHAALWPRLPSFHGRNPLETWVFGFCRNCLRSAVRAGARRGASTVAGDDLLATFVAPDLPEPDVALARREALALLQDELAGLPTEEREAVLARHLEGASFEDLARHSGVAVSTIKDRCYRAMQRLQQRLGPRIGD